MVRPCAKPTTINEKGLTAPTAAKASTPNNLETMRVSLIRYSCWKRFPTNIGKTKPVNNRKGLPIVMFFCIAMYISNRSYVYQ